jgi:hypothetical protein
MRILKTIMNKKGVKFMTLGLRSFFKVINCFSKYTYIR